MNPAALLAAQAAQRGPQWALIDRHRGADRTLTYAELNSAVRNVAAQLHASGLRAGDAVLVFHPVSIELYILLLAMFHRGLTAVFIDPGQGRSFIAHCCDMVGPRAFAGSPKAHWLRLLCPPVRRIPRAFHLSGRLPWSCRLVPGRADGAGLPPPVENDAVPALITFTSGSTGQPRGIARSCGFLMAQHRALETCLALKPGEVDLATLPVFVLANLASGLTTVLADFPSGKPGEADGMVSASQMQTWKVSRSAASPAFFQRLLGANPVLPHLRHLYTGGAPVFPSLMERLARQFPGAVIEAVYGSSEAEPIAHLRWEDVTPGDLEAMRTGRGLLAGRCVGGLETAVIAAEWGRPLGDLNSGEFAEKSLPPDGIGEIVVSGAHVVSGYLNGDGDSGTKFRVEDKLWHRTGDTGFFDASGRLWLTGRASAVIHHRSGRRLHPFQLETALSFFPGISASALMERHGSIVLVAETSGDSLPVDCRPLLEAFGVDQVIFATIPRDKRHNAKVDYPALRQLLSKQNPR